MTSEGVQDVRGSAGAPPVGWDRKTEKMMTSAEVQEPLLLDLGVLRLKSSKANVDTFIKMTSQFLEF